MKLCVFAPQCVCLRLAGAWCEYLAPHIEDVVGHEEGASNERGPCQRLQRQAPCVQESAGIRLFAAAEQQQEVGGKEYEVSKADAKNCALATALPWAAISLQMMDIVLLLLLCEGALTHINGLIAASF